MPVLEREEYIEQAYFFHTFRERLLDGLASQEILARIGEELLSTTKLPLAVSFLHIEMKGTGQMGPAVERINHYFTPFQAHVVNQAETDLSRFAMDQALLILEREAKFKAEGPSLPALFVFQFEALSRNRLGYTKGLAAMAGDPLYTEDWVDYILTLQSSGWATSTSPDLIFVPVRAVCSASRQAASNPEFIPKFPILFTARRKERSARNRLSDAIRCTFSRHCSSSATPEVPRPAAPDELEGCVLLLEQKDRDAGKPPQVR